MEQIEIKQQFMTMSLLETLAKDFWFKHGKSPTHILMTIEQQIEFSSFAKPKEKIVLASRNEETSYMGTVYLTNHIVLDILPVPMLRAGRTHNIELPTLIRIEE
jgi:hypothetical protein